MAIEDDDWLEEQNLEELLAPDVAEQVRRHINEARTWDTYTIEIPAQTDEARKYLGASVIGNECERAVWYGFRHALAPNFPTRIKRRFETGHVYEARVVHWLRAAGYEVLDRDLATGDQFRINAFNGLFQGHMDGLVRGRALGDRWHLFEGKAMVSAKYVREQNPFSDEFGEPKFNKKYGKIEGRWFETKRKGVRGFQKPHYCQMQSYMKYGSEHLFDWTWDEQENGITDALYIAMNTDTDQIHAEVIPFVPEQWSHIENRIERILFSQFPPERVSDNPQGYPCAWCDYQDICWLNKPMDKSCRNCSRAKLERDGAWICLQNDGPATLVCGFYDQVREAAF